MNERPRRNFTDEFNNQIIIFNHNGKTINEILKKDDLIINKTKKVGTSE